MLSDVAFIYVLVRLLQDSNAQSSIVVTLSGMFMLVRLLQPLNASLPIEVTLSGMFMLVRLLQPSKNPSLAPLE